MSRKKRKPKHKKNRRSSGSVAIAQKPKKSKSSKRTIQIILVIVAGVIILGILSYFTNVWAGMGVMCCLSLGSITAFFAKWACAVLITEIQTYQKGETYSGLCTGSRWSGKTKVLQVSWTQQGVQHFNEFYAFPKWKKFPYPVKVYCYKAESSLGMATLIPSFLITLVIVCSAVGYIGMAIDLFLIALQRK